MDKKNPWKGLESRAGNLLGAITMPLFAAHVYVNFRFSIEYDGDDDDHYDFVGYNSN